MFGLRLPNIDADKKANLQEFACQDPSGQAELGVLTKSVHNFFDQQNITHYPAVLTMVAAMRYGSVSPTMAGKAFLVDHDLDFMLAFPEHAYSGTVPELAIHVEDKIKQYIEYLRDTTGIKSEVSEGFFGFPLKYIVNTDNATKFLENYFVNFNGEFGNWMYSVGKNFIAVNVLANKHTKLSDKMKEDGIASGDARWLEKRYYDFRGTNNPRMPESLKKKVTPGDYELNTLTVTNINFWLPVKRTPQYDASPTMKTLFMGETFSFPQDSSVLLHILLDEFGRFHKASGSSLCDFSYPHGLYEEDMEENPATLALAKTCTKKLQTEGFANYALCDVFKHEARQ